MSVVKFGLINEHAERNEFPLTFSQTVHGLKELIPSDLLWKGGAVIAVALVWSGVVPLAPIGLTGVALIPVVWPIREAPDPR